MKLQLRNIAKIKSADIVIDGITVIAGENDTGKSTVGKALFALYHSFYRIEERIAKERLESVKDWLERIYVNAKVRTLRRIDAAAMADELIDHADDFRNEAYETCDLLIELIRKYDAELPQYLDKRILESVNKGVKSVLEITHDNFLINVIGKNLASEFSGQVCNIYNKKEGEINLETEKQIMRLCVNSQHLTHFAPPQLPLLADVTYIDDPFILDDYRLLYLDFSNGSILHQTQLRKKLFLQNEKDNQFDAIADRVKLDKIYHLIANACSGDIFFDKQRYLYLRKEGGVPLDVHNLSAGLKTFAILKMLLQNGGMERNGVLILDEPEIHLHPQWQLLFAEIIVLLQKEFDLHVLMNTHSPYFLRAIQVYAARHSRADVCKYYLSELDGDVAVIKDITACVEKVYAKLAKPFQKLEDERVENDAVE